MHKVYQNELKKLPHEQEKNYLHYLLIKQKDKLLDLYLNQIKRTTSSHF